MQRGETTYNDINPYEDLEYQQLRKKCEKMCKGAMTSTPENYLPGTKHISLANIFLSFQLSFSLNGYKQHNHFLFSNSTAERHSSLVNIKPYLSEVFSGN